MRGEQNELVRRNKKKNLIPFAGAFRRLNVLCLWHMTTTAWLRDTTYSDI